MPPEYQHAGEVVYVVFSPGAAMVAYGRALAIDGM